MANELTIETLKQKYLEALESERCVGVEIAACQAIGISYVTAWRWKKDDPAFAKKVIEAVVAMKAHRIKAAEYELHKKVLEGNMKAVMFTLENLDKENYGRKPLISVDNRTMVLKDPKALQILFSLYEKTMKNLPGTEQPKLDE